MLRIENLVVEYPIGRGRVVHAVSDVSFDVREGETLGIVGESGCGKSTTARAVIQLPPPNEGSVSYRGRELTTLKAEEMRRLRPALQIIFQDPVSSLNPRRKIRSIVSEPLRVWGDKQRTAGRRSPDNVDRLLESVGLDPDATGERRPSELSGGQCQRVSIARALMLDPDVIVCDEPVSALDVSVQAQILNLLEDMKERYGLTLLFISHDLSVVRNISDRVLVMYLGKVCEMGNGDAVFEKPAHPYTRALLAAIPDPAPCVDVSEADLKGELPSPIDPPAGCRFHTRCPQAQERCRVEEPAVRPIGDDHYIACHFPILKE
ncbi:ABC transporter ATP-binding protein [Dactylosporangium sp. AC04546]|nr:ABC transporter ATP-binding protein [Dactylosporangium sp. AC04546]WVK86938.1 ABC transporter ATP-binding protein [Dactylosporangium sp. AC04546]